MAKRNATGMEGQGWRETERNKDIERKEDREKEREGERERDRPRAMKICTDLYWVLQKLPQICTVNVHVCIGKVRDLQYIFALIYGMPSIKRRGRRERVVGMGKKEKRRV